MKKPLLFVLLCLLVVSPISAQKRTLWIYGSGGKASCTAWRHLMPETSGGSDWVYGFITGAEAFVNGLTINGKSRITFKETENSTIGVALGEYCDAHPDDQLVDAAKAIVKT